MKPKQWLLLSLIVVGATLAVVIALRNPQPPLLPRDEAHSVSAAPASCLDCHGPDRVAPRAARHPLGNDCLRCHGIR